MLVPLPVMYSAGASAAGVRICMVLNPPSFRSHVMASTVGIVLRDDVMLDRTVVGSSGVLLRKYR